MRLGQYLRFTLIVALWSLPLGAGESAQPTWQLPPGIKTLTVNSYPMAYVERGAGPTVVLVHGAINDYRSWEPQMLSLSPRLRVISVSLRHYYPEPWNGKGNDFSEKQHAEDVIALVEQLGTGSVYLVGHSRGGMVAILAARSRPELFRKVVLMEPPLTALHPPASGSSEDPRVARWRATAKRFETGDIEGGLEYFVDDVNGPGTWKQRTEAQRQVTRDNAWTIVGQLGDTATITCADVGGLKMPVLLVGGEKTTQDFLNILDATHKCLPSAKRVLIPNAGHGMHRQNSAAFDAALVKFLLD